MDKKPIISIIVPVYNVEEYLDRCVESILKQTFTDFELILVDDGSPDNCPQMCDEWAKKDNRIKVIHKSNGGLSEARNAGIEIVNTEWIMFVDSDDEVKIDALKTLLDIVIDNQCDIGCCSFGVIENNEYFDNKNSLEINIYTNKDAMNWYSHSKYGYTAWNKIYKTTLFDSIRYPKGRIYEDVATTYKLIDKSKSICFIDKDLFYYRLRDKSISHSKFSIKNLDEIKAFEEYYSFIKSNYPELEKRARRALVLSIYKNISGYVLMCQNSRDEKFIEWFGVLYNNRFFTLKNAGFSFEEKIAFLKVFLGKNIYFKLNK